MEKQQKRFNHIFVTGTDTGVGKTVLSLLLMQFFYSRHFTPFYLKPAQTGCINPLDQDSDARFVYQHVEPLKTKDPSESVVYCFKNPKAPYFAARDEGQQIDMNRIMAAVEEKGARYAPLIIEGAGGLFVPLTETHMVIDMIRLTGARPVIAARAALGTINHTLLTIDALRNRGMEPIGVVMLDAVKNGTPQELIAENMEAIEKRSGVKVGGVIGPVGDFSRPTAECFQPLEKIFAGMI